jgi:hypothetical protein
MENQLKMDFKQMQNKVNAKTYTLIMFLMIILQIICQINFPSVFGFIAIGFNFGLWLGCTLRWVLIK